LVTFPPVIALPVFVTFDVLLAWSGSRAMLLLASVGFGVAWPIAVSVLVISRRHPLGEEDRQGRLVMLGLGALGYAIGVSVLLDIGSPLLVTLVMFCYGTNTAVMLAINVFWKASVHAMGIAGPTVALVVLIGAWGALLSLLLLPVGWSRVRTRAHTPAQFTAGAALGFLLTGIQFAVALRIFA
jgi:uncharacterized membrane protein